MHPIGLSQKGQNSPLDTVCSCGLENQNHNCSENQLVIKIGSEKAKLISPVLILARANGDILPSHT